MISPTPPSQPTPGRPAPDPGAILPRSATLAAWLWAGAPDDRTRVAALRVIMHDDEPHQLRGELPPGLTADSLASLFQQWSGRVTSVIALFPGPGDAMGAPAAVSAAAIDAEECVLVTLPAGTSGGVEHWALVPDVEPFGSALEPGFHVTWDVARIEAWENRALGTVGSLGEAERELQRGLREATEALMELDVSRWRDAAGEAIAALREVVDLRPYLPRSLDPRRSHVFQSAARLRAIVDLATEDDGGAVNLWQADQRSTALREVDRAARRAMSAATLHTQLLP